MLPANSRRRRLHITELLEPTSIHCCGGLLDDQGYSCIAGHLVLQMTGGKLLACVAGGGNGGGYGCGGSGDGGDNDDGDNGGDLPTTDPMMMYGIVIF